LTLDGGGWPILSLGNTHPWGERTPVPVKWEAGWFPEPVWMVSKMDNLLALLGFLPRMFSP